MTTLTLELPPDVYRRLREEADRLGRPAEAVAQDLLAERLAPTPARMSERERAREVLRAAGLLAEPSPEMLAIAAQSTATLEEVQAAFARVGGKPLSEIVIEQRGPKE
jgi:plasmid stability protein